MEIPWGSRCGAPLVHRQRIKRADARDSTVELQHRGVLLCFTALLHFLSLRCTRCSKQSAPPLLGVECCLVWGALESVRLSILLAMPKPKPISPAYLLTLTGSQAPLPGLLTDSHVPRWDSCPFRPCTLMCVPTGSVSGSCGGRSGPYSKSLQTWGFGGFSRGGCGPRLRWLL